jgi:hypothetical protein
MAERDEAQEGRRRRVLGELWAESERREDVPWEARGAATAAAEVRRLRGWLSWIHILAGDREASDWAVAGLAGRPAPQTVETHPWWLVD